MKYPSYQRLIQDVAYQTEHGSEDAKRKAASDYGSEVKEAAKQISEDRDGLREDWIRARKNWGDSVQEGLEPRRDHTKAARARHWWIGAGMLFVIETFLAFMLSRFWISSAVLASNPVMRTVLLVGLGLFQTLLVVGVVYKIWATRDEDERPVPSLQRMTKIASWCAAGSIVSLLVFLLTRQFLVGGILFPLALAGLTITLGAGVAASLHCAEILHRPNRLAHEYDQSDKLLGKAQLLLERIARLMGGDPQRTGQS